MQPLTVLKRLNLHRIDADHERRTEVEHYVSQRYAAAFHADLQEFMPEFLVMLDANDDIQSVCGFRRAQHDALFLEQYLPQPADRILADKLGTQVERDKLVEFGQLASFSHGFSLQHFYLVLQALMADGYRWGIFTATDPLFAMLRRFGLEPTILAPAQAVCIPDSTRIWGTYYDHCPRIMAGDLSVGIEQLEQRLARRGLYL
ncbi:thermostable hemolysin [Vibrio zhugei]|uniref:Thermostable hemolysin n=1 Tax=Vibrio zhugei TaxID=2479546 RepID=A0ABV7C7B9_9VIBR|nr:thermostable hemolysin [Vibrio zhugei]